MKRICIFSIIFSFLVIFSCGTKTNSWWIEPEIPVLASDADWEQIAPSLKDVFEHIVRTPQDEKTYILKHAGTQDQGRYTHTRYLILTASLESKGRIGDLIRQMLSNPEVRSQVESGERFYFVRHDPWARGQLMIILTAKDTGTLCNQIDRRGQILYDMVNDDLNAHLRKEMFERGEQKQVEEELLKNYGWSIRLHKAYFVAQALPREGLVWFRRTDPERWIFVRWIENADTAGVFSQEWIVRERDRIGKAYYGNDRVAAPYLFSFRGEFLGRPAQIMSGLWENEEKIAGGPFRNYTFYDAVSRRLYMLDIACFAPEDKKLPFMRRLDVIAHTFRTLFDFGK